MRLREVEKKEGINRYMDHETVFISMSIVDAGAIDLSTIRDKEGIVFLIPESISGEETGKGEEVKAENRAAGEEKEAWEKRVEALYSAGAGMEEIGKQLGVSLAAVSKIVARRGLGKERYQNTVIPSKGSAPVKHCEVGR